MRKSVAPEKQSTTSIFTKRQPARGFGLESSHVTSKAAPEQQVVQSKKSRGFDLNRISMRPQAKLTVNKPGDAYEQEADNVAQQVVQRMNNPQEQQTEDHQQQPKQSQQQEKQIQTKSLADSITPVVQRQQESQQQAQEEEQEQVQAKSIASPVQRQQESQQQTQEQEQEEENIQAKSLVQQKSAGKGKDANAELESSIGEARGGGQPMADDVRQPMEEAIGADFSGVRIHTDSRSDNLNQSIQAKAFTTGQDVFFRQGEYSPGSDGGKELLAHELTHVVLHSGGGVRQKSTPSENAKTNKVQTKLAPISQSSDQTIQRKEISQQQVEQQENQGEAEQQATATTETQTKEQQIQAAPVEGSVAEIPPTDGGGAAGASTGGAGGTAGTSSGGGEQGGGGNGISGEDPGQIIEQLKNTPPTQAAAAHNQAQSASGEALDNIRQQQQKDMPEIPTPTGLSAEGKSEEKDSKYKYKEKDSKYKEKEPKNNKDNNKKKQKEKEKEKKEEEQGNSEKEQPQNNGEKSDIDNVNTDAGERPKVDMSGEADPSQVDDEQAKSDEEVKETKNKEAEGIGEDFGENDIFPDADNEILKAQKEISDFEFPAEEQLEVPQIPGEVVAGLDEGLTPHYQEQVTPEQEKYLEEKQHFDAESEKAKQDSDRQIEEENEKAKQEQTNQQQESQKEVEKLRGDWQSELDGKEEEYQKKAGKASKDQRKKIDDEKSKGEKDVDNKMTEAEQEAQKEKEAKQKEAEEKEKEKEEQSGWDRFWSSVGDFFAAIAEAIKGIFDALMDVISKIFEAVKEVVNGIIDLVRDAIIGLIEAFGEILKGIVKVVFAAFPEISKKFTDAIDGAVKKATEVVNKVADGLK